MRTASLGRQAFSDTLLQRVHGYLAKGPDTSARLIGWALEGISRYGAVVVDPAVADHLWSLPVAAVATQAPGPELQHLTEREVLGLVVQDCTDKEIADRLGIVTSTVEYHVHQAELRLGVQSRARLGFIAGQQGVVPG